MALENKAFDPCALLLHAATNSLHVSRTLGVGCPDTQRCHSWHRSYVPIELLPIYAFLWYLWCFHSCYTSRESCWYISPLNTSLASQPTSTWGGRVWSTEYATAVPPECNQLCNIWIMCSAVLQWYSEMATTCSSSKATWSFMIATSTDTMRTMPLCSPMTHWKMLEAHMHSKRFCHNLSSRQSNGKRSFPLTVSNTSFSF